MICPTGDATNAAGCEQQTMVISGEDFRPSPGQGRTNDTADMNKLRSLLPKECLALLGSAPVGRLVFTEDALPAIRPVNFILHDGDIVVRTSPTGALGKLADQVVAFEVDEIAPGTHTGWSVVAVGKVEHITDIETLVAMSDPIRKPWAPGTRSCYLRIPIEIITGREITLDG
jgi:nitroimidazol reductase NimA-like FMN-containing flavoprotein (pyridoxamine 5'-phosphate oxidase superfamily)